MHRAITFIMLTTMLVLGAIGSAAAQESSWGGDTVIKDNSAVNSQSNGQPVQGKVDEAAVAELERARELFEADGSERDVIRICLGLVETFEENKDYDHLVDAMFLCGDAYYYLGEWSNAERYMQDASDLGHQYFSDAMSTYPLKVIGECQFEQEKYDEALGTFQERVQLLRLKDSEHELAAALFDVAGLMINLGREEEAIEILTEALKVNNDIAGELSKAGSGATEEQRTGNVVDHAEIVYHLAIANFRLDRLADAAKYLEKAESFFRSIHESGKFDVKDRLVSVLDDLVLVNESLNNMDTAEKFRKQRDELNH